VDRVGPVRACPFTTAFEGPMIGPCLMVAGSFRVGNDVRSPRAGATIAALGGPRVEGRHDA
jgi:hypothetical protein